MGASNHHGGMHPQNCTGMVREAEPWSLSPCHAIPWSIMARRPRKDSSVLTAIGIAFVYGFGGLALFHALRSPWQGWSTLTAAVFAMPVIVSFVGLLIAGALLSGTPRPVRRSRGLICGAPFRSVRGEPLGPTNLSAQQIRHW